MKTRRALSTVVGTVFAIIAITSTMLYVTYSMNILNNFGQSVLQQTQQTLNTGSEKFQITSVTTPGMPAKFNITVANTGNLPINFTKIWVQNTTAPDWTYSYVPSKAFVNPGGVVTNIGQNIPLYYKPTASYNVKLVTSRGNSQGFTVNSASSAPLNIQLYAFPANIPSKTTTELVMIVTNNSTSTLVNLTPNTPTSTGSSTFTYPSLGAATPPRYNTLMPGQTAIFKWDLTPTGKTNDARTFTASLQNGLGTNTASTTVTIIDLTAGSSIWSTTWGILSIDYTSLQWSQDGGNTWNSAWALPKTSQTVWRVSITNNDVSRAFILNGNSTLLINGGSSPNWFVISPNYPPLAPYSKNSQTLSPGQAATVYFGVSQAGNGGNPNSTPTAGTYAVNILIYGYWSSVGSGNFFGQNIPYEGISVS